MAADDPLLEPLLRSGDGVTLYHTDSSFYSMIVRLGLEEKNIKWNSREIDIHGKLEQLQPWYMKISPGACVPTLVHNGKSVPESLDILRYIDEAFSTGIPLTPKDAKDRSTNHEFIKIATSYDVEGMTMGYAADWNAAFRKWGPGVIGGTIPKLEKIKAENPGLTEVCDRKIAQNKQRIVNIFGPPNSFAAGLESFCACCDKLSDQLRVSGGPYLCGKTYCMADVLFTNMLARGNWIKPARDAIAERPLVARYWKAVQARPSFKAAQIMSSFAVPKKIREAVLPKLLVAVGVVATVIICLSLFSS